MANCHWHQSVRNRGLNNLYYYLKGSAALFIPLCCDCWSVLVSAKGVRWGNFANWKLVMWKKGKLVWTGGSGINWGHVIWLKSELILLRNCSAVVLCAWDYAVLVPQWVTDVQFYGAVLFKTRVGCYTCWVVCFMGCFSRSAWNNNPDHESFSCVSERVCAGLCCPS